MICKRYLFFAVLSLWMTGFLMLSVACSDDNPAMPDPTPDPDPDPKPVQIEVVVTVEQWTPLGEENVYL